MEETVNRPKAVQKTNESIVDIEKKLDKLNETMNWV